MKKLLSFFLVLTLIYSSFVVAFAEGDIIRLAAHRGMNELAPENTIPAFEFAGQYGYYGLEFDLQLTKDGKWVVCHEDNLERMTNGKGNISDRSFDYVRKLKITDGTNIADYPDLRIPTLEEALDVCREYGMVPYIEIKAGSEKELDGLVGIVTDAGFAGNCRIISSTKSSVEYIKKAYPQFTVWFVSYFCLDGDLDFALNAGLDGVSWNAMFFKDELFKKIEETDLTLSFWTVDTAENAEKFAAYGSNDFTTNNLVYSDDGSVVPFQEGDEARKSNFTRIVGFVKFVINLVKSVIDKIRRTIGSFIPND